MEFFRDSNINFMGARRFWLVVSVVAMVASVVAIFVHGKLNIGIDFAGGTQLIVKFAEPVEIDEVREALVDVGIGEGVIQQFGAEDLNEVMIKTPLIEGTEEGSRPLVEDALASLFPEQSSAFDLNRRGTESLTALLLQEDPEGLRSEEGDIAARQRYEEVAEAVMDVRQEDGLIESVESLDELPEVTPAIATVLEERTTAGPFAVLAAENVGPQIGEELRLKGILAVLLSMIGMLAYIWWRFELRFGIGAVAAILHDVTICLGLYALADYEFNLTTVAAFLTVVGYSVNDSVVVFDRVRENLRRSRRESMIQVLNESLNQTLSRTVLTSGTTFVAVAALFFLGGEVIRGFAFVLMVGVIVGTYSSIFVASPIVLLWEQLFGGDRRRTERRKPAEAT